MTRPIYLLGDIHGDYAGLLAILDERKIRDAVVIHVGDGHEGFPECCLPVLETLNQEFATRRIEYLSIRGNHCNPTFFEGGGTQLTRNDLSDEISNSSRSCGSF